MQEISISTVDFGSSKISASIGQSGDEEFDILATLSVPSRGIEKGLMVDDAKCREDFNKLMDKLKLKSNVQVEDIYVGISNRNLRLTESNVKVSLNAGKVRGKDIKKALTKAKYNINLLDGEEVVDVIINYYILDEKIIYEDIVGWLGNNLEINVSVILGPSIELSKFRSVIQESGYNFKGYIVNSIATRKLFLQGKKLMGVKVLADIGAGVSDISIFRNGVLKYIGCIQLGGNNLTKDLSICGNLSFAEAENVKNILSNDYITIFNDESRDENLEIGNTNISKELFYEVVKARLEEILSYINSDIKNTSFCEGVCSIIVYGNGITYYEKISELIKEQFDMNLILADKNYLQMKDTSNLVSLSLLKEVFDRINLYNKEVSNINQMMNQDNKKSDYIEMNNPIEGEREEKTGLISRIKKKIRDFV